MIRAAGRLAQKHRLLFVAIQDEEVEAEERRRHDSGADVTRSNVAAAMLRDRHLVIGRLHRLAAAVIDVPAAALVVKQSEAHTAITQAGSLVSRPPTHHPTTTTRTTP